MLNTQEIQETSDNHEFKPERLIFKFIDLVIKTDLLKTNRGKELALCCNYSYNNVFRSFFLNDVLSLKKLKLF